jgi:hypothetical protein
MKTVIRPTQNQRGGTVQKHKLRLFEKSINSPLLTITFKIAAIYKIGTPDFHDVINRTDAFSE